MNGADRKGQLIAELAALYDVRPEDLRKWLESPARKKERVTKERVNKGGRPSRLKKKYGVPEERWNDILDLIFANRLFERHDGAGQPVSEIKAQKVKRIAGDMVDRFVEEGLIDMRKSTEAKNDLEDAVWDRWGRGRDLARVKAAGNPTPAMNGD